MLTHKNERPHVCPHCGKDFTRQHDWKRHMELHDPSKKFKCAGFLADGRPWGCNKEFARKDALSRHFKSQQVPSHPATQAHKLMYRDDSVLKKY
jgi:transcription factor CRZ1